ncbi:MAG: tetratricopeptide repeat protein [Planctomycetota bacterium]
MAKEKKDSTGEAEAPVFSEAEQAKARAWFRKAADCRERREYDYAIECIITGLGFWPDAVEEGHMPLWSLAIQRQQIGGKKPGMMEGLKKPMTGKDPRQAMLNAEHLLAKDPGNAGYMDGLMKNANRARLDATVKWIAAIVLESAKKEKKPNKARFKVFREAVSEAADRTEASGDAATACWLLEQAVFSLDYQLMRTPGDEDLRIEQRELSGKLAIIRGKYENAEDFRDSLRDGDQQKLLHDADRLKQGDESHDALVAAARHELEAEADSQRKINALVDILLRRETKGEEDQAIEVLMKAYQDSSNYSYKLRADDVRLRQLGRQIRQLVEQAHKSGSEDDQQQLRLAQMEQHQIELEVYRERVKKYPTDLRLKFRLGTILFNAGEYDEAIPALQEAHADPRSRFKADLLIGRAFFEKENASQASEVLRELLDTYELTDDLSKDATYWLGRALEAEGKTEEAKTTYGKLLRQDYNYAGGDARKRMEQLK